MTVRLRPLCLLPVRSSVLRRAALPFRTAALLLCAACASTPEAPPMPVDRREAERIDQINRLSEHLANAPPEDGEQLLLHLQRMMIAWQSEQRQGRAEPLENLINRKVVAGFEHVAAAFASGPHEQRLVAAWALGFSRVPENPLGIASHHEQALALLLPALQDAPDDLMRNVTLALWKLGDAGTPLPPLLDLVVNHHDPEVRANATLALSSVLTTLTAPAARDAVLVALTDHEPKVRLHAATVASHHPDPATSRRMSSLLPEEKESLVRASMARALGRARERSAVPALVTMLGSPRAVEAWTAHAALVEIFGVDRGTTADGWRDLIE